MIVSMSVCVCVWCWCWLWLVMCVRVTAQRWLINFARVFAFNFLSAFALPLCRFHKISVFLYFSYIAQLFCIFFFLWYSSKLNDFASALGLVNQIVAEYCLLFFRKPFRLSFYLIVCWQTDALNASRKWFCSLRFDDFKGQKEISLSALIFMSAN